MFRKIMSKVVQIGLWLVLAYAAVSAFIELYKYSGGPNF